jgi:hypothetical protein
MFTMVPLLKYLMALKTITNIGDLIRYQVNVFLINYKNIIFIYKTKLLTLNFFIFKNISTYKLKILQFLHFKPINVMSLLRFKKFFLRLVSYLDAFSSYPL